MTGSDAVSSTQLECEDLGVMDWFTDDDIRQSGVVEVLSGEVSDLEQEPSKAAKSRLRTGLMA